MAINRAAYPITFDEAIRVLTDMRNRLNRSARKEMRVGDVRPEILDWTIARLKRLEFAASLDTFKEPTND